MSWVTPITWTNTTLTAANLNTVRDDLDWLGTSKPMWLLEASGTSVTSGAGYADVSYATETIDTQSLHSTSSNTNRVTIATAGKYMIIAYMEWAANTTGQRDMAILKNGGTFVAANVQNPSPAGYCANSLTWFGSLAASDYLTLGVAQNSGSTLTVKTFFAGFWIAT